MNNQKYVMVPVELKELSGAALNWAVAKCEGYECDFGDEESGPWLFPQEGYLHDEKPLASFRPSTNWSQGGPIIEREITKLFRNVGGTYSAMVLKDVPIPPEERGTSLALTYRAQWNGSGPTPLIAAMRCYVCSELGDMLQIPKELIQ